MIWPQGAQVRIGMGCKAVFLWGRQGVWTGRLDCSAGSITIVTF